MELVAPVSTQFMLSNTPMVNVSVKHILMVTVFVRDQANTLYCGPCVICAHPVAACVASRPGQCGRCDGYILEGKELEFYLRKVKAKKGK